MDWAAFVAAGAGTLSNSIMLHPTLRAEALCALAMTLASKSNTVEVVTAVIQTVELLIAYENEL